MPTAQPTDAKFLIHRAQCLFSQGRRGEARQAARSAMAVAADDPALWDAIGTLCSYANYHSDALEAYDHAVRLAPSSAQFIFNRASIRRFLGDLEGAEADYDRVIALNPADYEAYLNRSELRVQTPARNHVVQLEALAAHEFSAWPGEVQILYAVAKELEDLGQYSRSFDYLRRGAGKRRRHLQYDVAADTATVDWIIQAFPHGPSHATPGAADAAPIFIVGLPRSGTTLVERILGSHPSLSSAGELDCFALALVEAAHRKTARSQLPRRELVQASATVDFAALGRDYLQRAAAAFDATHRCIDKMPLNYLYCGLIHRALPNAKIIHVTRHPMAVGYAMYKTLFKQAYPFSYDLDEIAQYYVAYHRLMQHWHASMPDVIHRVGYEDLVADQRGETQKLLRFCGLDWHEDCVAFHRNPHASTTASAAQVRRPLYDSSVALWRRYQTELAGLNAQLRAAGIDPGL